MREQADNDIEKAPTYTKRICCTKPELTVFISGDIHIKKIYQNQWGHVHFITHADASQFFHMMENKVIEGPQQGFVTFSKSIFYRFGRTVDYVIEPIQDTTSINTSTVKSPSHYTPYALIQNNDFYLVKFHTQGVRDNNRSVIITAESETQVEENGTMIRNDLPSKFEVKIDLQISWNIKDFKVFQKNEYSPNLYNNGMIDTEEIFFQESEFIKAEEVTASNGLEIKVAIIVESSDTPATRMLFGHGASLILINIIL
ncbi:hypothetical protein C1646_758098 [Rhizophagus diaphanus]|nr:hypothetical protein C1646_758098 [Rhizophagus diaphanus] [Rhizophagus sp. MUCL 43196]